MNVKMLKRKSYQLLCLSIMFFSAGQAVAQESDGDQVPTDNLETVIGESKVLTLDFTVSRVSVGSASVLSATQIADNQLLINGVSAGTTNLILWSGDEQRAIYQVNVTSRRDLSKIAEELTSLFEGIEGIRVKSVGGRNVIEGTVYSNDEVNTINQVLESYAGVINLTKTGEVYNKLLATEIKTTIGIDGIDVRYTKSGYILDGVVISEFEAQYAYQIAKSFSDKVINALYIDPNFQAEQPTKQVVQLDLKIVEVSIDKFTDKINDFTAGFEGVGVVTDSDGSDVSGTLTITDPNLRKLQEDSKGRVLIEQSVIVASSKTANLFVGDEIPVPVQQGGNGGISIEFKDVGIDLDITPKVYRDKTIDLEVSITSSNLTGQAVNGAPELSTARINTSTRVPSDLNVVFAGLISQRDARDFVGNAGNPDKDKRPNRFADDRREVLVMIKPKILKTLSDSMPELKQSVERSYKDYELRAIDRK